MTSPSERDQGIPVFMIGRSAENGKEILPALAPEFDSTRARPHVDAFNVPSNLHKPNTVIHFCTSTAAARQELPVVLDGKPVSQPQTTLGSNTQRGVTPRKPAAIFVGAGFDREDYEAFRGDVGENHGLPWVREEKSDIQGLDNPDNWMFREGLGRVPKPEVLVKSVSMVLSRDLLAAR
ncbi:hypothetical protein Q7P35_002576 [Cladosporium inversicolor]